MPPGLDRFLHGLGSGQARARRRRRDNRAGGGGMDMRRHRGSLSSATRACGGREGAIGPGQGRAWPLARRWGRPRQRPRGIATGRGGRWGPALSLSGRGGSRRHPSLSLPPLPGAHLGPSILIVYHLDRQSAWEFMALFD